jgi:Zn-dependent protease
VSKILKYGILEDIDTVQRIPVGRFWNVTLLVTPITWLGPVFFFVTHFVLNLLNDQPRPADRFYQSMLFTIAVEITTILHAFGHILSGKMVNNAMDELLITTTRDVNVYHGDQSRLPGYVHLARSLGGPLFNLLVAGVCISVSTKFSEGFPADLITSLIGTNLFFGLGSFLPIPSVDGEVIWREILRPFRARSQKSD